MFPLPLELSARPQPWLWALSSSCTSRVAELRLLQKGQLCELVLLNLTKQGWGFCGLCALFGFLKFQFSDLPVWDTALFIIFFWARDTHSGCEALCSCASQARYLESKVYSMSTRTMQRTDILSAQNFIILCERNLRGKNCFSWLYIAGVLFVFLHFSVLYSILIVMLQNKNQNI